MSENANFPSNSITHLGIMFQIQGFARLGSGILFFVITEILLKIYRSLSDNVEYLIEYLNTLANLMVSTLLISLLYTIGLLILDIFILISLRRIVEDKSYSYRLLHLIYILIFIGIIINFFIVILSYIFQGYLIQDSRGLISYVELMDEQIVDDFYAKMRSFHIFFGILFLLVDLFFVIISFLWCLWGWGKSLSDMDSIRYSKFRLNLGFLYIFLGHCVNILDSVYYILGLNKPIFADSDVRWFAAALIISGVGQILVGFQLKRILSMQIFPKTTSLKSHINDYSSF